MPLQELVSPWDQQPQEAADLGPLAEDFPSIFLGGYDVRSGLVLTATTQAVGPVGREARLALSNGQNTAISPTIRNGASWAFVAALRRTSTVAGASYFLGLDAGGSPTFSTHFTSTGRAFLWDGSGIRDAGFSLAVDENAVIGLAFDSTSNIYFFFKNGVLTAAVAGSAIAAGSAWRWNTNDANTTNIALLAISDRRVSVQRMVALTENPWQLFQRREWIPFSASSGGGVTGTSSGTLALTGAAAGSIRVSGASAGTLALGGSSAGSVRVTGASAGTLALSGTSTGTVGATGVTGASSGTLALTGTSTGTVRVSGASTGALGLTGSATGSVRVSGASAGTLSLTGAATGNTTGAVSGASVGVLSLSGSATGSVRVSGGSAAVLQITGSAGAQIIVRGVSAGVLSMSGSATAVNGDAPAVVVRAALSSRTRIRQDGAGTRPAQRSTGSRPRQ